MKMGSRSRAPGCSCARKSSPIGTRASFHFPGNLLRVWRTCGMNCGRSCTFFPRATSRSRLSVETRLAASQEAQSVVSASVYAEHFTEEINMGRAFNSGARHFGFEFLRSYERARLFQILPFEEQGDVVDASGAAENVATVLAVLAPPVEGGIERRFPGRIVGNFVVDEKVNHDGENPPLNTLKTLRQTREKCKGRDHREVGAHLERWSGRRDLNSRPLAPQASALPGCATSRWNPLPRMTMTAWGLTFRFYTRRQPG